MLEVLRCPVCSALVDDRRFSHCTTCQAALPPEMVLLPTQAKKLEEADRRARAEHAAAMDSLEPGPDEAVAEEPDSTDLA
jgi:hypothetical protein